MQEPSTPATKLRILAADDNAVNRMVITAMLHRPEIELCVVEDGQAAVDAWHAHVPHLVLLDIVMPILDGFSAARKIRKLESELSRPRVPIYAITGEDIERFGVSLDEVGIDGLFAKPIRREQLEPLLARFAPTPDIRR